MNMQDRLVLSNWLRGKATLDEVEQAARYGLVDNQRFSENAPRAFKLIWTWSSARFSGPADKLQSRFAARCGYEALERRMNRVQAWAQRLS